MLRRTIVAVILTVSTVVAGVLLANQPVPTEARQERFEPAFTETFDGPRLDRDVWATCYWWNRRGCTNESTGERQWYTRGSVTVSDGKLVLTARRRSVAASDGRRYPYTSGMVTTGQRRDTARARPGFAFKYGRVSARVRVPAGRGLWAALWMVALVGLVRGWRPFLIGLVLGAALAVSIKTILLVGALLLTGAITLRFRGMGAPADLRRRLLEAAAGFALIPLALAAYFAAVGAWDELVYCNFVFNGRLATMREELWIGRATFPLGATPR